MSGEKVLASFSVGSKFGTCVMHMTNLGLAIENNRFGMILDLEHGEILSCLPIGKHSARLTWDENQSLSELILQCDEPELVCSKYCQIQEDHTNLLKTIGMKSDTAVENITIKNPLLERKRSEQRIDFAEHDNVIY